MARQLVQDQSFAASRAQHGHESQGEGRLGWSGCSGKEQQQSQGCCGKGRSGRLEGKVAIVTGVGSKISIGYQSAVAFGREGAKVLCVDVDSQHLEEAAKEIQSAGSDAVGLVADVTKDHETIVSKVLERWGRLDIYFANAGVMGAGLVGWKDISSEVFMKTLQVNTLGVFLGIQSAVKAMERNKDPVSGVPTGGSILVTASVAGLRAGAGPSDYSASKAAVISLVQTIAFQLPGTRIRVNAICPGLIETGMTSPVFEMARERGTVHKIGQLNPTKRAGNADEVAKLAVFLASDEASYVNGQAIPVDGGLSCALPHVPGRIS